MTPWEIKGRELVNCTCEYGCNCQFNALPDKGHCHAVAGIQIDEGHYGKTKLDGLRIAAIFKWPGPIHEGNCEAIAFVDEKADQEQRGALFKIMTGQDTNPFATMFAVYAATVTKNGYDSASLESWFGPCLVREMPLDAVDVVPGTDVPI